MNCDDTVGVGASEPAGWHAPGIGEVHNADHSLMLFCTKANPDPEADPDYLPDDKLAERVAALLNASGVALSHQPDKGKAWVEWRGHAQFANATAQTHFDAGWMRAKDAHGVEGARHQTFRTDTPTGERAKD